MYWILMFQLDVVRAAAESAASEQTGGSRRRRLLFLQCLFFTSKKVFLPRQCGSSSAWPWTRQKPRFQPEWLLDKNQFITAILLRVKLWMCPRVMWYSFGGNTECCFKTTPQHAPKVCFVLFFISEVGHYWEEGHCSERNIILTPKIFAFFKCLSS